MRQLLITDSGDLSEGTDVQDYYGYQNRITQIGTSTGEGIISAPSNELSKNKDAVYTIYTPTDFKNPILIHDKTNVLKKAFDIDYKSSFSPSFFADFQTGKILFAPRAFSHLDNVKSLDMQTGEVIKTGQDPGSYILDAGDGEYYVGSVDYGLKDGKTGLRHLTFTLYDKQLKRVTEPVEIPIYIPKQSLMGYDLFVTIDSDNRLHIWQYNAMVKEWNLYCVTVKKTWVRK